MKGKSILSCIIAFSMIVCSVQAITAFAESEEEPATFETVPEEYQYAVSLSSAMVIDSGTANCYSVATGIGSVYMINATQYLEKRRALFFWDPVDSWFQTTNGHDFFMYTPKSGLSSGTYRLRTVFTLFVQGGWEEIEVISDSVS